MIATSQSRTRKLNQRNSSYDCTVTTYDDETCSATFNYDMEYESDYMSCDYYEPAKSKIVHKSRLIRLFGKIRAAVVRIIHGDQITEYEDYAEILYWRDAKRTVRENKICPCNVSPVFNRRMINRGRHYNRQLNSGRPY